VLTRTRGTALSKRRMAGTSTKANAATETMSVCLLTSPRHPPSSGELSRTTEPSRSS
jgi:hypothetical protein